jgi:tetratricopeptide (TPR) repeat protein
MVEELHPPVFIGTSIGRCLGLVKLGRYQEALTILDELTWLPRRGGPSYFLRGFVLGTLTRHTEALNSFNIAWQLGDRSPQVPFYQARSLFALGRVSEAMDTLDKALRGFAEADEAVHGNMSVEIHEAISLTTTAQAWRRYVGALIERFSHHKIVR